MNDRIDALLARLEDIRDERHFPAHMMSVHEEMVEICEALRATAPKPLGDVREVRVDRDSANSHFLDHQIIVDGECIAFANDPWADLIAASLATPAVPDREGIIGECAEIAARWINATGDRSGVAVNIRNEILALKPGSQS
jgi:hypothetical protein